MTRRTRSRLGGERGAELVEMAIVLPVLLVLIAGIVDFGLLLQGYLVATNAAREGARLGALPGYDENDYETVKTRVANYFDSAGLTLDPGDVDVAPEPIDLGGGDAATGVRVTVTYTHDFLLMGPVLGLVSGSFADDLTYTTQAVMRTEVQ